MSIKRILVFIIIILGVYNLIALDNQIDQNKKVLILFSGSHEMLVYRNMLVTLENILEPNNIKVEPEYLEDNLSVFKANKEVFLNFVKQKYGENRKFDLIVSVNKNANKLCQEYGEVIFPDTQILPLDIYKQRKLYFTLGNQIENIHNLHQDLEHLLIISDASNRGNSLKELVQSYIESFGTLKNEAIYIDFGKLNYSEIENSEYYSSKNNVVMLLSAYMDASLNRKDFSEQIEFLDRELESPIYNIYEKENNAQVLGGCYLDVEAVAEQLSNKIMLMLNNMPLNQIDLYDMDIFKLFLNKSLADKYKLDIINYEDSVIIERDGNERSFVKIAGEVGKGLFRFVFLLLAVLLILSERRKRKYKKELLKDKKIYHEIFDKSHQYILVVDTKSGVVLDFNQKVGKADFANYIIREESKITDFFSSEIKEILTQSDSDSYLKVYEIDFNTKTISFPTRLISLNFSSGEKLISYIQFSDISETKQELMRLNNLIADAESRVHESKSLIDHFILEIRDPLNVNRGFEKLLQKEELTKEEKAEYEEIIALNSRKLLILIEKIFIFSELNNNTRILNNQQFSINKNIRKISTLIQNEIKEKGKNVKLVNYFSLDEGKDILFNDREYFCLVFKELLENAAKFTNTGTIECGYTHPNDGKIIFYIKDSGIGMTADEQREAFTKFNYYAEPDENSGKSGIGLGLAICRNLITQMEGNIWLTSNSNEGITVYFYLDFDMSVLNESQSLLQQTEINIIKQKSILIIDEDIGTHKFIKQTLNKYDIKAKSMPNCQFYNKYNEDNRRFDIIFFDYNSGLELFLRENKIMLLSHNTSLIIVTRGILDENFKQNLEGLKYCIIYKPIKIKEMISAIIKSSK